MEVLLLISRGIQFFAHPIRRHDVPTLGRRVVLPLAMPFVGNRHLFIPSGCLL